MATDKDRDGTVVEEPVKKVLPLVEKVARLVFVSDGVYKYVDEHGDDIQ